MDEIGAQEKHQQRNEHEKPSLRVVMLHYKDDPEMGGSVRVGQHIANHVDHQDIETHIVFVYEGPGPVAAVSDVPCHFPRVDGRYDVGGWLQVRNLIREIDPDVLHFQDPLTTLRAFLADLPAVTLTHCHGRPLHAPQSLVEKAKRNWRRYTTDQYVCIDPVAAETLKDFGFAREGQCVVLPNAVDVDRWQDLPSTTDARSTLSLPQDVNLMGMVGRLIEPKGFPDLFRLLQMMPSSWHAMFAGDGGDRTRMERTAEKKGIRDRMHFVGALDDVRPAYAAMDAYVFLCQHEPFGLVLAEAMASGVPLFGLHGMGEYRALDPPLINDQVATFFEREDPERFLDPEEEDVPESDAILDRLREALLSFDPHSPAAKSQIEAAREHVRTHFDVSIQARRMTRIYKQVANGK